MSSPNSRVLLVVFGLVVLFLPATGVSYYWAHRHVRYYTGAEPRTLDCLSCHVLATGGGLLDRLAPPRYYNPLDLALSPEGTRLYVTAQASDSLLIVDVKQRQVVGAVPVETHPHSVALSPDGRTAYVSNEWSNSVSVVDLEEHKVVDTFATGHGPTGITLGPDGSTLFVANRQSDSISVIDLHSGREITQLAGGSNPNQMALSPDGRTLAVSSELSFVTTAREAPSSEVTLIDTRSRRVIARPQLVNAHLLEGVAVTAEGDLALVALSRPKNLLPAIQVARGWMVNNGLGVINLRTGEVAQLLLDEVDAYFADPFGVTLSPDGQYVFVTHSGTDCVSVVSLEKLRTVLAEITPESIKTYAQHLGLSSRYVVRRINTGANPKGLAVSPQGDLLYVAERLEDRILAVNLSSFEPAFWIELSASSRESIVRRGEKLFNSASATFQGQFSCRSCHPNNHVDRLQYDFEPDGLGRNIVDNRTLLGIRGTGPFKWNGKNTSMFMQCGIRFARILTRLEPFAPDDLSALVAFMRSLSQPPNPYRLPDGKLTPSQQRGEYFFERVATRDGRLIPPRNRCITCHPPPFFTNRQRENVGTGTALDSSGEFDTPQLNSVYHSAPYLHDGRAKTLEEIWTLYNPDDGHGVSSDMTKADLNDLIQYLKTL